MSPGATFERVYRSLKEQLGDGRFRPGEHLEPRVLSDSLNASITPVRDALHRLVGERLVDAPRGDGFRTPTVTELGLRHLYAWSGTLLVLAARSAGGAPPVSVDDNPPHSTERLFARIAQGSGNPEHVEAVLRLNDRLRLLRTIEPSILGDPAPELQQLAELLDRGEAPGLRRSLAAFHRRRERIAPQLVELLLRDG
jgi:DNA-binding transcriptional MocR family regulator